jgi:hypothetical protein
MFWFHKIIIRVLQFLLLNQCVFLNDYFIDKFRILKKSSSKKKKLKIQFVSPDFRHLSSSFDINKFIFISSYFKIL